MIESEVEQNGKIIMRRVYYEPTYSLETVLKQLEKYIVNEQLNTIGECLLRVRFNRLSSNMPAGAPIDTSSYTNITLPKKGVDNEQG